MWRLEGLWLLCPRFSSRSTWNLSIVNCHNLLHSSFVWFMSCFALCGLPLLTLWWDLGFVIYGFVHCYFTHIQLPTLLLRCHPLFGCWVFYDYEWMPQDVTSVRLCQCWLFYAQFWCVLCSSFGLCLHQEKIELLIWMNKYAYLLTNSHNLLVPINKKSIITGWWIKIQHVAIVLKQKIL